MKKILSLVAAALMSMAMMAGQNDLLWDYSEAKIPTTSPDRNLYYGAYVNDAPSTNMGLNGVKMNSSGYAYFTKAAVAGKLKLTFGPRKSGNSLKLAVWTWEGDSAYAQTLIKETPTVSDCNTEIIDLTAEQNNIYITRPSGTGEGVLQKIQFLESVPRTFVDFEMIMCNMASEYDFSTLPAGVTAAGTFNTDQHGYRNFTIDVPVDGTVRFTIGDCRYGNQPIVVKNCKNDTIATLAFPAADCYGPNTTDKVFQYIYLGEADTLHFGPIQYCNYFKAEAAEITPCEVTFKDQNGSLISKIETYEGATLGILPEVSALPEIPAGSVFRGWFYNSGKKAQIGDAIAGNTTIQAKVTPIEDVIIGTVQTYDFASPVFYPEDHETVEVSGGSYYNTHGWYFNADGSIRVKVAGNAVVLVSLCKYSETGDVNVMAGDSVLASYTVTKDVTEDGTVMSAQYAGEAGWLTINWTAKQYIHKVVVYNVLDFPEKDEATGYFIVPAGDAASFIMALTLAQSGDKIFLPNGVYDLGETCLTAINKSNIAIIGQSMEGVVIKNKPLAPGIGVTATILIDKNVSGTYLQDLTIQDDYDYYKSDDGVGVALQDKGTKTVCKNVCLLSRQDTYYSNLQGAVKYFEDCEIHGTVDFICGDGSVYFYGTELVCEQRAKNGGGSDALTASNADASDKGYVFEHCTVRYADNLTGAKPIVSLGRSWNNKPKTVFLNTFLDDSNGELVMVKDATEQKDKIQRWTLGGMNVLPELFGEYNSVDKDGKVVSPASNNVTFILNGVEKQMETILTAEQAATYTMAYTLGEWSATAAADAAQVECDLDNIDAGAIYLVEAPNGNAELMVGAALMNEVFPEGSGITVRKANARGGFGRPAGEEPQGMEEISANAKVLKIFRDGQVIVVRGEKEYTVFGQEVK